MTLFQHTLKPLLRGEKTETSRLALPDADGEHISGREMIQFPSGIKTVMRGRRGSWFVQWQVGKDYAIQPGRGIAAIGRYRLVDIWRQDVRTLTAEQVAAEGFRDSLNTTARVAFFRLWTSMHDKKFAGLYERKPDVLRLDNRPTEFYMAWRMKIEVLYATINWDAVPQDALPPWRKWTTVDLRNAFSESDWRDMYINK